MASILVRYKRPRSHDTITGRLGPAQQLAKALRQSPALGKVRFKAGIRRASPYGEILVGALTTAGAVGALYKTIGIFLRRHKDAEIFLRMGRESIRIRGHSPRQEAKLLREFQLNRKGVNRRGRHQQFWEPHPPKRSRTRR